ncbi:50S ribosomal protein L14e [Candidatus Woesearchaeota archaeon]|nr:50S ribosomal protein L14e [Candidatus Woesearchaeota archaeon]
MIQIGRLVAKIAGRDAGRKGIVIDMIDNNYVLIDGQFRRKKCNITHLEPLGTLTDIKQNASHEEVIEELKKIGIQVKEKTGKAKQKTAKPVKKGKQAPAKSAKKKTQT